MHRWYHRALLPAFAALALYGTARAQAPHAPIRGTIEAVDGDTLKIATAAGEHLAVHVAADARVTAMARASLADVKPDSYVGMANRIAPDGSQTAIEVHIFPEAARGTGDGERDWDLGPKSRMTNGAITAQVAGVDGQVMTVKYAGGESKILVTPKTPIVAYEPGDRAELKAGAKVFVRQFTTGPDGGLEAHSFGVGRDGLTPPM